MKNLFRISLVAILAMAALTTTSCNKYEEGPSVTLLPAKSRMAGDWQLSKYTVNGTDYTSNAGTMKVTIDKDGTYSGTISYNVFGSTVTDNIAGTWEFNGDKTKVSFLETGETSAEMYDILMLKNKEMKLQQIDGSTTYQWTYIAQ